MDNQNVETTQNDQTIENTTVETTDTKQDVKPEETMADKIARQNKQYETSAIKNQMGITKEVVINEGTKYEYTLTLQFPGVAVASDIEDDATKTDGNIRFSTLMREALENDVIVRPHIKSLDFWNTHKGYGEVAGEVLNFLNSGINGDLQSTAN